MSTLKEEEVVDFMNGLEKLKGQIETPIKPEIKVEDRNDQALDAEYLYVSSQSIQFGQFTVNLNCSVITLSMVFLAKDKAVVFITYQTWQKWMM